MKKKKYTKGFEVVCDWRNVTDYFISSSELVDGTVSRRMSVSEPVMRSNHPLRHKGVGCGCVGLVTEEASTIQANDLFVFVGVFGESRCGLCLGGGSFDGVSNKAGG